jgi:hypothetical protein
MHWGVVGAAGLDVDLADSIDPARPVHSVRE